MSRSKQREVKRQKNKKVYLSLLLLLISVAIIIGFSVAFFSDIVITELFATIGTLKLDFKDKVGKQYYTIGNTEHYIEFEETIENLNPGDIAEFGYKVINLGNKSAFVKTKLTITVTANSIPEDILEYLYLFSYDASNPVAQRANIREDMLDGALELVLIDDTVPGTQVYEGIIDNNIVNILNGKEGSIGREIEEYGRDEFLAKYLLYLSYNAENEYQGIQIDFDVNVESVQYRNNTDMEWSESGDGLPLAIGEDVTFDYIGNVQEVTLKKGKYRIECWGADGAATSGQPGKGGYSSGILTLNASETVYIYVGEKGVIRDSAKTTPATWNFNGGGRGCGSTSYGDGGGGTDVRLIGGAWDDATGLTSRIIVAGGGGFGSSSSRWGGNGGGIQGASGSPLAGYTPEPGTGGSQTAPGITQGTDLTNSQPTVGNIVGFGKGGSADSSLGGHSFSAGGRRRLVWRRWR